MRVAYSLLIAVIPLSSGCSVMIEGVGKDLGSLKTKEDMHAQFGQPDSSGAVKNGEGFFEEFHTRQKISTWDPKDQAEGYTMLMVMSFGTAELILTPIELCRFGCRTVLGQSIRVVYNSRGEVTERYLDGESLGWLIVAENPADAWMGNRGETPEATVAPPLIPPPSSPAAP